MNMITAGESLKLIEEKNKLINAFVYVDKGSAGRPAAGKGALSGVPVAVKDNICVKDQPTTCASRILKGFKPPYDATVVRKLKEAGAVIVGKANMDEFAFGSSCETSCYGPTRNPWNLETIPGGSSGGSAAAVSAGFVPMALGSDTGGSIRQPASLCGVCGMKPTYGRVSRYGLIAFASSLDQIGPITKNIKDLALLLSVIAGHDEYDSTSVDLPVPDYSSFLVDNVKDISIGVPEEYFIEGIDLEVKKSVLDALDTFRRLGAKVEEISLPHTKYALSCYYIVAPAEASSNLARFDGVQYGLRSDESRGMIEMYIDTRNKGFGDEAKRRILLGTYSLSSGYYDDYYLRALKVRTKIKEDFEKVFRKCDIILTPTSPTAAFKLGEKMDNPLSMYLSDIYTIPVNLAGIPAVSIPCGFTKKGLPIGMQLMAKPFNEETLIRASFTFQEHTEYHLREPGI